LVGWLVDFGHVCDANDIAVSAPRLFTPNPDRSSCIRDFVADGDNRSDTSMSRHSNRPRNI